VSGSLHQRGKGGWWYAYFRVRGADGRWTTHTIALHTQDREEAAQRLRELEREMAVKNPARGSQPEPTLGEWLDEWVRSKEERGRRPKTIKQYRDLTRLYIKPALGDVPLRDLTADMVRVWQLRLAEAPRVDGRPGHLSPRTRALVQVILASALDEAVRMGKTRENPARQVELPRPEPYPARALTEEELRTLLSAARGSRLYHLWVLLATTGVRVGEALALTWDDVDLVAGEARIRQAKHVRTSPVARVVPLPAVALRALREAKDAQERAGTYRPGGPVIASTSGTHTDYRQVRSAWARLLARAGLGHLRIHDLRHTVATLLLSQGVPVKTVQEMLGHRSEAFLLQRYGHALPSHRHEAARAMDALLLPTPRAARVTTSVTTRRARTLAKSGLVRHLSEGASEAPQG
jgi:integrase